eukprot:snap_masked-scaffold_68-processed-gene-0.90-mRNA-1 protein AED:1.00 eAED:1.00 QI:0/0/0/0/1/1/2/0/128
MNLDGSWTLNTSSSAEEMPETLNNYVARRFRTKDPKLIALVPRIALLKLIFSFDLKKNTYIFQVFNLGHIGYGFRKFSTAKKYLNDLTEAELETLHILDRAETSIAAAELALNRTFPKNRVRQNFDQM